MRLPELYEIQTERDMINVFNGYNHNLVIDESEFYDMKNMSSEYYPALSSREKRGTIGVNDGIIPAEMTDPKALIAKDYIAYVDGTNLVYNNEIVYSGLSSGEKQLVSMGSYLIVFPDNYYYNTRNPEDSGSMEHNYEKAYTVSTGYPLHLDVCDKDGENLDTYNPIGSKPSNPENGDRYIAVTDNSMTLKIYSSSSEEWLTVIDPYTKINSEGIGVGLKNYDAVNIKIIENNSTVFDEDMSIYMVSDDWIVVSGLFHNLVRYYWIPSSNGTTIKVQRYIPKMDYVIESGNRLWGCRYGWKYPETQTDSGTSQTDSETTQTDSGTDQNDNEFLNEIYACKLGDFKNWNSFMGVSTDSYAVSLGSDGCFTGASTHNGYPIFFKNDRIIKIFGNMPSNYQTQEILTFGVQEGSSKSIVTINGTLFYKSDKGICSYDGGYASLISNALGNERYKNASAGHLGGKYYISMSDDNDVWSLFVFDTSKGLWHKEDDTRVRFFAPYMNDLYFIDGNNKMKTVKGSKGTVEDSFDWSIQSGVIGFSRPDNKYVSRFNIRAILPEGSKMSIYIKYDSFGEWEHKGTLNGKHLRSFTIPVIPRRCDHFNIKIEGKGDIKIVSIAKTLENGSDVV